MSTPLRIGVIGLGFMGAAHLRAWQKVPGVRVAALCNPSGRNLDGDLSRVGGNLSGQDGLRLSMEGVSAYKDPVAFIRESGVDIVDICTPTSSHSSLALSALEAGRHVLVEKPLARTSGEARRLRDAAAAARAFIMPAMCIRFWPQWVWLKRAVDSGEFGAVRAARFRRVAQAPGWGHGHFFRGDDSGGALLDLHIHDVDFAQWCFGRPEAVMASGFSAMSGAVDHVVALHRLRSGITLSLEGSWAMSPGFGFSSTYTVIFERATADFDTGRGGDALKLFAPGREPSVVKTADHDGYQGELDYFAGCVRDGKPPSVVTLADAVSAIEICEAEERSVREREWVRL